MSETSINYVTQTDNAVGANNLNKTMTVLDILTAVWILALFYSITTKLDYDTYNNKIRERR